MNQINKFIAGLNDFQRKLLFVAIGLVLVAFLDRLFIAPTMSHLNLLEDDIAKEQNTIKQDMRFLAHKDRVLQETQEVDPYITKTKLSDDDILPAFNDKVQNMIVQYKITCKTTSPKGEEDDQYWKYQTDLDCTGNLGDMVSFMHAVNADPDLMKVDKFSFIGKKSDTDDIKATMTIEKIVVTDKPMPPKAQNANPPAST